MPPACHSLPRLRFADPQRGSQGCCAPFLPPAFMRGEGHAVAGGVPRSDGESLLSHGFAVPAPPEGKPRGLRPVPAPQRGSRGRFAPFLSIRNGLRFRFLFAGRGLTGAVYSPPEMQVSVASGRGKWGQKRALWDVHNPAPENFAMFYREKCIFRHRDRFLHLICFAI